MVNVCVRRRNPAKIAFCNHYKFSLDIPIV